MRPSKTEPYSGQEDETKFASDCVCGWTTIALGPVAPEVDPLVITTKSERKMTWGKDE